MSIIYFVHDIMGVLSEIYEVYKYVNSSRVL